MDTKQALEEMREIMDLRLKVSKVIKKNYLQIIDDFVKVLELSNYKRHYIVLLKYVDDGNHEGQLYDERSLIMWSRKSGVYISTEYCTKYSLANGDSEWGNFSPDWEETDYTKMKISVYRDTMEKLIKAFEDFIEDEKKQNEDIGRILEKSNEFIFRDK